MKDEKKVYMFLVIIFGMAALLSFIWAADDFSSLFLYDPLLCFLGIASFMGTAYFVFESFKTFDDPDQDWRKAAALIFAIFTIAVFAGYKATHVQDVKDNIVCSTPTSDAA